jgi:TRAP-type C4-dicarboxylate transport system permease small subunit
MEPKKNAKNTKSASSFETILGKITSVCLIIAGLTVVLMSLVTTYGVARRYMFHSPDNNAYLFSCVFMVGCVVFAIAHIQFEKKNIWVDYISKFFPRVVQDWLQGFCAPVLGLVFCVILTWQSWDQAWFALESEEHTLTLLAIPTYPMRFSVVFGAGLLCLVLLTQMVRFLVSRLRRLRELSIAKEKPLNGG